FFGSGLPSMRAGLGPSFMTATLGCPLNFLPETTWTEPAIADWNDFEGFPDYRQNRWYQLSLEMMERVSAAASGRCVVMLPDLHPGGDGVASLRGNENFMMDLYDCPDQVRMALEHLDGMFIEMLETYYRICRAHGQSGSAGFTGWGPNKTFPVQDDTLALVSPAAAREFLLPGILRQARSIDNATFHLDGPEALDKLEMLLEASELRDIQWVPGAAHQEMTQWIPVMKRILAAGKLLTTGCKPEELEPILSEVPARGLRLYIMAEDEDQARELLQMGARLSR
ncbi:MAG: hypothetical protein LC725_07880, partial [Lentisphaerae bacterium]|nr:hypothetical protein [Lentisphaerota bacterium]